MYQHFFAFTRKPFTITPDPSFLYLSEKHQEALAHLLYSTDEGSSFIVLSGEVGTGKTLLCRSLLEQAPAENLFALIFNPMLSPEELLTAICEEFGAIDKPQKTGALPTQPFSSGRKQLFDILNAFLLACHAQGQQAIVVIDEAQNLSFETLELVRLLTNLETEQKKLLKLILVGQPELRALLSHPGLRQLDQRITARYHLQALSKHDVTAYVRHRLTVAGQPRMLFTPRACKRLFQQTQGYPRLINLICDRALMGAFARQQEHVDAPLITLAAREVLGSNPTRLQEAPAPTNSRKRALPAALLFTLILAGFWWWQQQRATLASDITAPPPALTIDTPAYLKLLQESADAEQPEARFASIPLLDPDSLQDALREATLQRALSPLSKLWGLPNPADAPRQWCLRLPTQGFQCRYAQGTLDMLGQFNLPAILEIENQPGIIRQVLLTSLNSSYATLVSGAKRWQIQRGDLANLWGGRYLMIWQLAPNGSSKLVPGDTGSAVAWLADKLAAAVPAETVVTTATSAATRYDAALKAQVQAFQRHAGLIPDGIAGELTLITLEGATADAATPTLHASQP